MTRVEPAHGRARSALIAGLAGILFGVGTLSAADAQQPRAPTPAEQRLSDLLDSPARPGSRTWRPGTDRRRGSPRRLAVRHEDGWTFQRPVQEALERLDAVPLPARCSVTSLSVV